MRRLSKIFFPQGRVLGPAVSYLYRSPHPPSLGHLNRVTIKTGCATAETLMTCALIQGLPASETVSSPAARPYPTRPHARRVPRRPSPVFPELPSPSRVPRVPAQPPWGLSAPLPRPVADGRRGRTPAPPRPAPASSLSAILGNVSQSPRRQHWLCRLPRVRPPFPLFS